jgi:hypothetical protein
MIMVDTVLVQKVGLIKGYLSRNPIEFCESETVNVSDVPDSQLSLRAVASKFPMRGGQAFFHCNYKNGSFKTSRCKCRKFKVLCNSRCHQSLSCTCIAVRGEKRGIFISISNWYTHYKVSVHRCIKCCISA